MTPRLVPSPTSSRPGYPKVVSVTVTSSTKAAIIEDCLRSVLPYVDECLVLHLPQGHDDTLALAQAVAGARLQVRFPATDSGYVDYLHAGMARWRNDAIQFAADRGADWAIMLDTDERIHLPATYRIVLASVPADVQALDVQHADGTYAKPRLIRTNPLTASYVQDCHEDLRDRGPLRYLDGAHFTELPKSPEQMREKCERDRGMLAAQIQAEPDEWRWRYYLGDTLAWLGFAQEAVDAYADAIDRASDHQMIAWIRWRQGRQILKQGYPSCALTVAIEGLALAADMPELHYLAAASSLALQEPANAIAWARTALLHGHPRRGLCDPRTHKDGPIEILKLCGVQP